MTTSTAPEGQSRFRRSDALEAMRHATFDEPPERESGISWPSVPLQQAVLSALVGWANGTGVARAVTAHLARQLRVDERTIRRACDALETLGYIERTHVAGWRALAYRICIHDTGPFRPEPTEHERQSRRIAKLERELAAARDALALGREANEALDALAGAEVIELPQRADDDARPDVAASFIWQQVCDGDVDRRKVPLELQCPKICGCGGRYRIRTCDFVRVKDALTALPSLDDVDPQAQRVQASFLAERKRRTGLGPRSFRQPPTGDVWDAAVSICCALEADDEGTFVEASEVLCAVWFQRGGRVAEERWRVDWMKNEHEKLLLDTRAELRRRKMRERARMEAPARSHEPPPACRGICAGGRFKNPACDDCACAAMSSIQVEQRARAEELGADEARARARERLAVFEAELRAEGA